MRTRTAVAMVLSVGVIWLWHDGTGREAARAQAAPPAALQNGDANGDGARDIADPVYLLAWLFSGGPEPVAFAQEGGGLTPEQAEILSYFRLAQEPASPDGDPVKVIQISGVNLQILNGEGETVTKNGLGNLIIGYNESNAPGADRSGSHNLVVGPGHQYSSYGGAVFGADNTISGEHATVTAGSGNTASGRFSTVSASFLNTASGTYAAVSGGCEHVASGTFSAVSGGQRNRASGDWGSVSGGLDRAALAEHDWQAGEAFQDQ